MVVPCKSKAGYIFSFIIVYPGDNNSTIRNLIIFHLNIFIYRFMRKKTYCLLISKFKMFWTKFYDYMGYLYLLSYVKMFWYNKKKLWSKFKNWQDHWEDLVFSDSLLKSPAYSRVALQQAGFVRPVVLFGPVADIARNALMHDHPDHFSSPRAFCI